MMQLYFAYGSNMSTKRLCGRIPAAAPVGRARLDGMRLAFNKPGRDRSGKANLVPTPGSLVWGVLFEIARADWATLDRFETGYERVLQRVELPDGRQLDAHAYLWRAATADLQPLDWYRAFLLEGAREHGLPDDYIALLERQSVAPAAASRRSGRP